MPQPCSLGFKLGAHVPALMLGTYSLALKFNAPIWARCQNSKRMSREERGLHAATFSAGRAYNGFAPQLLLAAGAKPIRTITP